MHRFFSFTLGCLLLASATGRAAEIKPGAPFGDHMVLQHGKPAAVFGTADPGAAVNVGFAGQRKTATADADGKWKILLDPLPVSKQPADLTISRPAGGTAPLVLHDVLVGDVWICSGQSNMAMTAGELPAADAAAALGDHPLIRLNNSADKPAWIPCTAESVRGASAIGLLFGERMLAATGDAVPMGIVTRAVGGTEVERWLDPLSCQADPQFAAKASAKTGKDLYRALIEPLMPMTFCGMLWYQGEQNAFDGEAKYEPHLLNLIRDWRILWQNGDFPFLIVQLPNINPPKQSAPVEGYPGWMDVRAAQFAALRYLPNIALTVTFDIGDTNAHPANKPAVADRLALAGRALVLGQKIEYMGPVFEEVKFNGAQAILRFGHEDGGLEVHGDKLEGFAVAGADGNFHWADARISGKDTVTLSSAEVAAPTQVRYAWANNPLGNLYNKAGLPTSTFRSDLPAESPFKRK